MNTTLEKPLSTFEVRVLNRVGLFPQNLPSSLDDFIRRFLWDKAEVDVSPVSSKTMIGGSAAALGAGIGAVLVKEGGVSVGTSFTTQNIKQQTGVQEWIHWKKYALDSPDFEQYRIEETEKSQKNYEIIADYIRSDKGKVCCRYEQWRHAARFILVFVCPPCFAALIYAGWIVAPVVLGVLLTLTLNSILKKRVTLPEWLIQKMLGLQSFASIKPQIQVIDGLLELEY